jgi:hypothetical protein
MSKIKIVWITILVLNLIAMDVAIYLLWNKKDTVNLVGNNECPASCDQKISERINNLPTPIVSQSPTLIPTVVVKKTAITKIKSTQYVPIPGSGTTLENKWVDLTGTEFYISTDDYPDLNGAYFEANMKLVNGNGLAYLRLFDITAGVEVWGSEISTSSQNFTSVSSGKLTIRNGTHLYRVQAKSLTADTTVFNSGRIKFILEN